MNTTVTDMEEIILEISINNWTTNATNIVGILKDLWYMIQSNIEEQVFQIQRMLANKLDRYKGQENTYMNKNIWEIQKLYIEEEQKRTEIVQDNKVILIKLYKISKSTTYSSI